MTYQGIDTAARLNAAQCKILRSEGISFVARYLVPETMWKALTAQEANDIRNAGLALMLCWEIGGEDLKQGAPKGAEHGKTARQLAEKLGVPGGVTIYFACDYNPPQSDYTAIEQYILAAQTALGNKYVAGLYGPLAIVDFLSNRGTCKRFWQCVAWSQYFSQNATVRQYQWSGSPDAVAMGAKVGVAVDLNATETLYGMWLPEAEKPWYADAMAWAEERHIINDGRPNDPVTRAELATVLYRMFGPSDEKSVSGMLTDE